MRENLLLFNNITFIREKFSAFVAKLLLKGKAFLLFSTKLIFEGKFFQQLLYLKERSFINFNNITFKGKSYFFLNNITFVEENRFLFSTILYY